MIARRAVLASIAASAALGGRVAKADWQCSPFDQRGVQFCEAGLRIGSTVTARQACENWCWAACIEAIFALHGHAVDQEAIVTRVFGGLRCLPADGPTIIRAVSGRWRSRTGQEFQATAEPLLDLAYGIWRPDAVGIASQELMKNNPLINGALGHATVMTAMSWVQDVYGRQELMNITVRDPWPGSINRRVLSPQEAYATSFLARVRIS